MVKEIKKITIHISMPYSGLAKGKTFKIIIKDSGTLAEALAKVDEYIRDHPMDSIFPLFEGYIHNYLQLIWNPKSNILYDDIGIMAYGPQKEFMPLHDNAEYQLLPDSEINIQFDFGC